LGKEDYDQLVSHYYRTEQLLRAIGWMTLFQWIGKVSSEGLREEIDLPKETCLNLVRNSQRNYPNLKKFQYTDEINGVQCTV
jgi:hypothetical protein